MADEENIIDNSKDDLDSLLDDDESKESKVEQRIKQLSNKVKLTSEERDELAKAKGIAETERDSAKKEVEFYSAFSDTTDRYPNAKEYKDQIKEKVMSGYSVEDAAVAVLAKEGKLTMPAQTTDNPAGGSATNTPMTGSPKELDEMTKEEKREEFLKAVERGDIGLS